MTGEKPLRILQVTGGLNRGGTETWLLRVLRNIDRERFRMDFLVHTEQPGDYDDEVRALGSAVIPCLSPSRPWVYGQRLKRIMREHGPYDVVHSHVHLFNGLPLWLAAQAGVRGRISHIHHIQPAIYSGTGAGAAIDRRGVGRRLYERTTLRLIARYATAVLYNSHDTMQTFRTMCDCRRQREAVVYCGIDMTPFSAPWLRSGQDAHAPLLVTLGADAQRAADKMALRESLGLPCHKPIICYVARFVPHKNHAQVIRVADQLNRDGYRFHFALAGSHGSVHSHLQEQAKSRPYVSLHLGLPDISRLMLASDLFFFPSLYEGFGIVAVEAAAAGLPIVATDIPAIREASPPSHHCYMFSPNDDNAAAAHIVTILGNPALWEHLSADAQEWAPRFSIAKSVDDLVAIYSLYGGRERQ